MIAFYMVLIVLAAISFAASLLMVPFMRFRRRGKWLACLSPIALTASFIMVGIEGQTTLEKSAREEGYASWADQQNAQRQSLTSAAALAQRRAEEERKRAEMRRQREAEAAQRAAEAGRERQAEARTKTARRRISDEAGDRER